MQFASKSGVASRNVQARFFWKARKVPVLGLFHEDFSGFAPEV
jgi:hypothetical protein